MHHPNYAFKVTACKHFDYYKYIAGKLRIKEEMVLLETVIHKISLCSSSSDKEKLLLILKLLPILKSAKD